MRVYLLLLSILLLSAKLFAGGNTEFRAAWVVTWEHISPYSSTEDNKARVRLILDNLKKANMNAVLWQVRQSGTAYYNSSFEPWGYYAGYKDPGYDPLAYAIEEAHKRGMELHAWYNVFNCSDMVDGAPAKEHPEWVCRDGYGQPMPASRALSPGLQEVRDYNLKVAMEIVNNYDIDGLHLDYVRWNEFDRSDFSSGALQKEGNIFALDGQISQEKIEKLMVTPSQDRYLYDVEHPYDAVNPPAGFASWEDWWRWSVTEFVHALHDSIQQVKPWVRLSPAALGKYNWTSWQGYGVVYQDAALWFNNGYIDQLTPMHYHWTTGSEFYGMLIGNVTESWGYWIQPGIDAGRLYTVGPGSYALSDKNVWDNHKQIVDRSRDVPWVDGFQFFSYASWKNHNYFDDAKNLFFNRKTKIRAASFLNAQIPAAPVVALTKIDDQNYRINISPDEVLDADQRFCLYRSEDDVLDVDSDEIIDIHFGRNAYTVEDSVTGLQDFNGKYKYFATRLNRFWNESAVSNSVETDSIPSFAPVVLSSDPLPGDTISINSMMTLDFSKTMDTASFNESVIFEPVVEFNSPVWSSDRKQLTIIPAASLQNDTEYTLTIKKEATDINGRQLDGNGDGVGSEDFILTFRTIEKDIFPPRLVYSNPDMNVYVDNFDVADIFSFAFDELLDHTSLQTASTVVTRDGQEISHKAKMYDIGGRTILSVQTDENLPSGHAYQISLFNDITDTAGNALDTTISLTFETEPYSYKETTMIDNFSGTGYWREPGYSGSTNGIDRVASTFDISSTVYLPNVYKPLDRYSGRLHYVWDASDLDPAGSEYLLRDYLDESPPRNVFFGTDYILQCYILGDGSHNKFRFALDEGNGVSWPNHEVSVWFTIDWIGWKLIQWDLSDPEMVGSWLGNGQLDMSTYRIDSFQLTHDESGAGSGTLYFSNLRVVKKQYEITNQIADENSQAPFRFSLLQNYPNPFNPETTIPFDIAKAGKVRLTIYNVLGQVVAVLVNKELLPGRYEIDFSGQNLASGIYVYELRNENRVMRKRMILLK
ncbi:MAG: family 10 glycosylhydrolase [Calditrichia bacterium]